MTCNFVYTIHQCLGAVTFSVWLTKNGFFLSVMCVSLVSLEIFKSPIPLPRKSTSFPLFHLEKKTTTNSFLK